MDTRSNRISAARFVILGATFAAVMLNAADRKAAITPVAGSITAPVIGFFDSTEGRVMVEGVAGAAHARRVVEENSRSAAPRMAALPPGFTSATATAVSDDGSRTLAWAATGVYERSGDAWRLVTGDAMTAASFAPHSTTAALAAADRVYLLTDSGLKLITTDHINRPLAIAVSDDGRSAVVLNTGGTDVRIVDLESAAGRSMTLGAAARGIVRGDSALIFVPAQGISPWLLDSKTGQLSFAPELPGGAIYVARPARVR